MSEQTAENGALDDDGPECDLCGKTDCPDADLAEFSEPRECILKPVYEELRYDRCDYGCGRDITKATVRRAARLLAERVTAPLTSPAEPEVCKACHGRKVRLHGWAVCPAPCQDCNGTGQLTPPATTDGGESDD